MTVQRIGIMQPYFFPYWGHFALIAHTDRWIVFDITQYTPKTWINRNAVIHPDGGRNWISISLRKSSTSMAISEAAVADMANARASVLGKLSHYRRHAPHYRRVVEIVKRTFDLPANEVSLVKLNVQGLKVVCEELDIPFKYDICSELSLNIDCNPGPGRWALEICKRVNASSYINPIGGEHLFDRRAYLQENITIEFLRLAKFIYSSGKWGVQENLSILDVLMWNSPEEVRDAIRSGSEIVG